GGVGTVSCADGSAMAMLTTANAAERVRNVRFRIDVPPSASNEEISSVVEACHGQVGRMLAHRTGTAVAVWLSVRAPFLAWIILAVLLLVAGHLTHAADTETSKVWRSTE